MAHALGRYGGITFRLGEDERSLQDGLHVRSDAFRRPRTVDAAILHGSSDVGLERVSMPEDALRTGIADRGVRADRVPR